jgi:hypothetical protein
MNCSGVLVERLLCVTTQEPHYCCRKSLQNMLVIRKFSGALDSGKQCASLVMRMLLHRSLSGFNTHTYAT